MVDHDKHKLFALMGLVFLGATFVLVGAFEPLRMTIFKNRILEVRIVRGAERFANNCATCHGPLGEGVVGPPLDRPGLRGDPSTATDVAEVLFKTIARGRKGTLNPRWDRDERGFISRTAMPAFSRSEGGPFNDEHIRDVVAFIMAGDWTAVAGHLPPPDLGLYPEGMPDAQGLTAAESRRAKELMRDTGCLACHQVGAVGGRMGPALTTVGSWGIDEPLLRAWITDPRAVTVRGPDRWAAGDAVEEIPLHAPVMPPYPMAEEDLTLLVRYLLGLRERQTGLVEP